MDTSNTATIFCLSWPAKIYTISPISKDPEACVVLDRAPSGLSRKAVLIECIAEA